jgi:hypothetical protein
VLDRSARSLAGGWHRREAVGIVARRTAAGGPTAVRAMSRPRRGNTLLEPESGLVRANFEGRPGQRESLLNVR